MPSSHGAVYQSMPLWRTDLHVVWSGRLEIGAEVGVVIWLDEASDEVQQLGPPGLVYEVPVLEVG